MSKSCVQSSTEVIDHGSRSLVEEERKRNILETEQGMYPPPMVDCSLVYSNIRLVRDKYVNAMKLHKPVGF